MNVSRPEFPVGHRFRAEDVTVVRAGCGLAKVCTQHLCLSHHMTQRYPPVSPGASPDSEGGNNSASCRATCSLFSQTGNRAQYQANCKVVFKGRSIMVFENVEKEQRRKLPKETSSVSAS